MRILIIRHADPDYTIDGLTETGKKEAEFLKERLLKEKIDDIYVSPLGRAQLTALPYLTASGKQSQTVDWLREFDPSIDKPNRKNSISWDWLPKDWTKDQNYFDKDRWDKTAVMEKGNVSASYQKVVNGMDNVLSKHGYLRDGLVYHTENGNHDTVAFFCHFGVECVLLSHLINVSPMILWHGTIALPSSVTVLRTEEREKGIAYFRMSEFGSLSHLYGKEEPSFSGRFCECYEDIDRHN